MDEISCFNNIYSDRCSLEFDNLFSTIDFERFESKENETLTEINYTIQYNLFPLDLVNYLIITYICSC